MAIVTYQLYRAGKKVDEVLTPKEALEEFIDLDFKVVQEGSDDVITCRKQTTHPNHKGYWYQDVSQLQLEEANGIDYRTEEA